MSPDSDQDTSPSVDAAESKLQQAADSAKAAEERATAEIRGLEADLEKERLRAAEQLKELRGEHEEELERERSAKERAIAAAESRLAEIEAQAEAAERRVEAAESQAAGVQAKVAEADARARESAAAWLRGQVEAIRREAGQQ
jgi:chromosome segregation ATPase